MQNTGVPSVELERRLLDVKEVAALCSCSVRHVYRLADAGKMPSPARLGVLVRWPRSAIEDWIANGCPDCRSAGSTRQK